MLNWETYFEYPELVYKDKRIDDFINSKNANSKVWFFILDTCKKLYTYKTQEEDIPIKEQEPMLNAVAKLCTLALVDDTPGENFTEKYSQLLGNKPYVTVDYIQWIAYQVMIGQQQYYPHFCDTIMLFKMYLRDFEDSLPLQSFEPFEFIGTQQLCFDPTPLMPDSFCRFSPEEIWDLTNNMDQERIKDLLLLWKSKEDKLAMLDLFEKHSKKEPLPF